MSLGLTSVDAFPQLPAMVRPVALLQAPEDDSRWYAVEQDGQVKIFANTPSVAAVSVFVDISSQVDSGPNEAGLLGMAFHPNFANNGEVFLSYTVSGSPLVSIVSRFLSTDGGLTLDRGSEEVVLQINQDSTNHNGGQLSFGPDGYLYLGSGDGGGGGDPLDRAQDTTNMLGAILRIDVDTATPYSIPDGNPFSANENCAADHSSETDCPEIYAWGLRNPWRWSFDRDVGDLWVGDVGQGAWEEINKVAVGENYGWNIREGAHCFPPGSSCSVTGLIDPVAEYDRSEGVSVTGGYVYRGQAIEQLQGVYVFGDFGSGTIWGLFDDGSGGYTRELLLSTAFGISSFAEGNDGEIYIVDLFSGRFFKIQ